MSKKLIEYQEQEKHKPNDQKTVPSGVKSPNSDREMLVVLPLVEHPQIKGLFKAIDPGTKTEKPWTGWVEYTPSQDEEPPTPPKKSERDVFMQLCDDYRRRKSLLDLGIFSTEELGMTKLAEDIRKAYKPEYI